MRQRVLQRLRPIRTEHDAVVRMHARALVPITAHTPNVPFVEIPAQILDLLVHEADYGTWAHAASQQFIFPSHHFGPRIKSPKIYMREKEREKKVWGGGQSY